MGKLAEQIKSHGMRPGLWIRPLCAAHDTPKTQLMMHSGHVIGEGEALRDPTVPETAAYLQRCFQSLSWMGIWDGQTWLPLLICSANGAWTCWVSVMTNGSWMFHNRSVTNAEVILNLYRSLRNAAGDIPADRMQYLLSFGRGLFEVQRIGDDTSGKEWARTLKMGVNSLAFRIAAISSMRQIPDCVGLTTEVDWRLNKQWMRADSRVGTAFHLCSRKPWERNSANRSVTVSDLVQGKSLSANRWTGSRQWPRPKWTLNGQEAFSNGRNLFINLILN